MFASKEEEHALKTKQILSAALASTVLCFGGSAWASPMDIDSGDSYPTEILIASPYASVVSTFYFNSTYVATLSDANYLIDASFNSDGSLSGFNSVTITTALNTGYTINGSSVLATFEWQSASGSNTANFDAASGAVTIALVFKINFTGAWKGGTETCRTGAFTVSMSTSGNTMPHTAETGIAYSSSSGNFQAVSNGVDIPDITGTSCTAAHKGALETNLSVGGTTSTSAMNIDLGYATYAFDAATVHGS